MASTTAPATVNAADKSLPNPMHPDFVDKCDPDFLEYYYENIAKKPATHSIPIAEYRANPKKYANPWCRDYSDLPYVKDIKITSFDGYELTARCYTPDPETSPAGKGPYPIHLNFHGGGFTFGDLTGDAEVCKIWRDKLGIMVLDVNYRHSPEYAFGVGHDDGWAVIQWVHKNGAEINARGDSISIGGISAGATISAVAQQLARDAGVPLKLAILGVPLTVLHDTYKSPDDSPYPSFRENALAPSLNWARISYFRSHWIPKNEAEKKALYDRGEPFRSPLAGDLTGVCDTFVATTSLDPLRDEGEDYVKKLVAAGVRTTARRYTGVPHPFIHMASLKKAQMFMDDASAELVRVHFGKA